MQGHCLLCPHTPSRERSLLLDALPVDCPYLRSFHADALTKFDHDRRIFGWLESSDSAHTPVRPLLVYVCGYLLLRSPLFRNLQEFVPVLRIFAVVVPHVKPMLHGFKLSHNDPGTLLCSITHCRVLPSMQRTQHTAHPVTQRIVCRRFPSLM